MAKEKKTGWINIHLHSGSNEIVASRHPYPTKEEAEKGIYIGPGVQKLGIFLVEWDEETV